MGDLATVPTKVNGFVVLPLALPTLPSFPVAATHFLYVAQHRPKEPVPSASRSLFLVNIPFDATESHFKYLFSTQLSLPAGRIETVELGDGVRRREKSRIEGDIASAKGRRGKKLRDAHKYGRILQESTLPATWDRELFSHSATAIVVFVDRASMEAVLTAVEAACKSSKRPAWAHDPKDTVPPLGVARYQTHEKLMFPDKAELLASVNEYMTALAAKEAEERETRARMRQEPDDDGFITVTRGGRSNPASQASAQAAADKHKSKKQDLDNFYRFQGRERRKARANELKRKFEEDRDKVRQMREKRKHLKPE